MVERFERARMGLCDLLDDDEKAYRHERDTQHVRLQSHPFNSETIIPGVPGTGKYIFLLAFPGHTSSSVRAMKIMLRHQIKKYAPGNSYPFRLRITRIQKERDWNDRSRYIHDLYFELITYAGTFICGGCNDYSGTSSAGGRELENIFQFLGALFDTTVEEKILVQEDQPLVRKLIDVWNAAELARHTA